MAHTFYKVNEIFVSIQGEGVRRGIPSVFLRLAQCNLRGTCWKSGGCDTEFDKYYVSDVDTIVEEIKKSVNIKDIVLTGGEPTLQYLNPLVSALYKAGYRITMETNGLLYPASAIEYLYLYSCSPKFSNFKVEYQSKVTDNIVRTILIEKPTQIKFVVSNEEDIRFSKNIIQDIVKHVGYPYEVKHNYSIFFQPHETESTYTNLYFYGDLIKKFKKDRLLNKVEARFSLQDHKVLGLE